MSTRRNPFNRYLWQPHRDGTIYLRLTYLAADGRRRAFTRSLDTNAWATARAIRDADFLPIIQNLDRVQTQLDIIRLRHPQLVQDLLGAGPAGPHAPGPRRTVRAVVAEWERALRTPGGNYAVAPATAKRYRPIVRRFVARLGADLPLVAITPEHLTAHRDRRLTRDGAAKQTLDLELGALRRFFAFAGERHGLARNPAVGIGVRRSRAERHREERRTRRRPPTHAEADRLCRHFPADRGRCTPTDYQDFSKFARYTGMRLGEMAWLKGSDLVWAGAGHYADVSLAQPHQYLQPFQLAASPPRAAILCFHLRDDDDATTKTGTTRLVPVAAKLLPVVNRRVRAARGDWLFPCAAPDRGVAFGCDWRRRAKRIHRELTLHGFRHYATSEMENNGVNPAVSRLILGHADAGVHDGYFHRTVAALRDAIDRIY